MSKSSQKKQTNKRRMHSLASRNGIVHHVPKILANMKENLDNINLGQLSLVKNLILRKQEDSAI